MDSPTENFSVLVACNITFKVFTNLLEQINKIDDSPSSSKRAIPKNEEKKRILQKFHEHWLSCFKKLKDQTHGSSESNPNYFSIMRLLLPADDKRTYGLKEVRLAKYLIDALCIAPKSDDALKLINYRTPNNITSEGDFASVAYFVLRNRCQESNTLSIQEINNHLDIIASNNAKGKEGLKQVNNSLKHLLVSLSALQLKWLIRIILKDLKIGVGESLIFESFHPDAMDLFNYTSSLEKVCETLTDPSKRLHEIGVQVFTPCRPMLGEKAKQNKIETLFSGREFYIETKFDGERFQLHKQGSQYKYFSRNSHEYTSTFGGDIHSGTLTPHIHQLFKGDARNLILDGEMCSYSRKDKMILSLPEEHAKARETDNDVQTCFCVFDVLLYNDKILTNKPLKRRVQFIEKSFQELEGRLMISQREAANSKQQVVDALNEAIDNRLEGIVVKDPESVYKPSVRSGSGWYKIKPDYMLGLNDDLDLVIIGGYYGTGKRAGILSHFLLAIAVDTETSQNYNEKSEEDSLDFLSDELNTSTTKAISESQMFYSFCKLGSGYTYKELKSFNDMLASKWVKFDKKKPPANIAFGQAVPDVWIDPKDSLVVQVKAVEITHSDKYKTGLTLRFPRLEKFRTDKPWHECMKLSELRDLYDKNNGKLASGKHFDLDDYDALGDGEPSVKKKRMSVSRARTIVSSRFKGVDSWKVNAVNNIFDGKEFCVCVGTEKHGKSWIEERILECGGEIVQNPGPDTFCVVTSKLIHKINIYNKKDLYDVVKLDWLLKCFSDNKLYAWKPTDMFHSRIATKISFEKIFDPYGDSYTEDLTIDSIKELFLALDSNEVNYNDKLKASQAQLRQIAYIENTYFPCESDLGIFRLNTFYVDVYQNLNKPNKGRIPNSYLELIELKLKWHGATIETEINEDVSHCIIDAENTDRIHDLKLINRSRKFKFHIVDFRWVIESIKFMRKLDELAFHV